MSFFNRLKEKLFPKQGIIWEDRVRGYRLVMIRQRKHYLFQVYSEAGLPMIEVNSYCSSPQGVARFCGQIVEQFKVMENMPFFDL